MCDSLSIEVVVAKSQKHCSQCEFEPFCFDHIQSRRLLLCITCIWREKCGMSSILTLFGGFMEGLNDWHSFIVFVMWCISIKDIALQWYVDRWSILNLYCDWVVPWKYLIRLTLISAIWLTKGLPSSLQAQCEETEDLCNDGGNYYAVAFDSLNLGGPYYVDIVSNVAHSTLWVVRIAVMRYFMKNPVGAVGLKPV